MSEIQPVIENGRVFCECGSVMHPEGGRRIDETSTWLWWRCFLKGHITCAVPLPRKR